MQALFGEPHRGGSKRFRVVVCRAYPTRRRKPTAMIGPCPLLGVTFAFGSASDCASCAWNGG
jgi:hypothetical protein